MKYQVQIKYTNPSHEHVTLRRRVESVTRLVEAANEQEALNRAANQQRALGFMIKEAAVVKSDDHAQVTPDPEHGKKKKKLVGNDGEKTDIAASGGVKEGFDPEPKDIAAHLVGKHGKGKVTKDHVDAYERGRDSNKGIDKETVMKHVQKMSEEAEQVDEGSYLQYSGVIHSNVGNAKHGEEKDEGHHYTLTVPSHRDVGDHLSGKRAYSRVARENPHLEPHHVKAILQSTGNDKEDVEVEHGGKTYKHRLYNNQDPDYIGEEVELDEAQKKLKPSYWKAEWRLGTQSEVDKNNKKIYDKLAKTDPDKAKKFHDNLMKIRKEEVEQIDEVGDTAKGRAALGSYVKKKHDQFYQSRMKVKTQGDLDRLRKDANKNLARAEKRLDPKGPFANSKFIKSEEVELSEASKEGKDVMRNMRAGLKSMDLRHGVDSDKRDSGYKMSPAVRAAQAKSDALSKREKKPQAGTLAAKKVRNAAEKMVNRAKGNANKIDVEPSIEPGKPNA